MMIYQGLCLEDMENASNSIYNHLLHMLRDCKSQYTVHEAIKAKRTSNVHGEDIIMNLKSKH